MYHSPNRNELLIKRRNCGCRQPQNTDTALNCGVEENTKVYPKSAVLAIRNVSCERS